MPAGAPSLASIAALHQHGVQRLEARGHRDGRHEVGAGEPPTLPLSSVQTAILETAHLTLGAVFPILKAQQSLALHFIAPGAHIPCVANEHQHLLHNGEIPFSVARGKAAVLEFLATFLKSAAVSESQTGYSARR